MPEISSTQEDPRFFFNKIYFVQTLLHALFRFMIFQSFTFLLDAGLIRRL